MSQLHTRGRRGRRLCGPLLAALLVSCACALGVERVERRFDQSSGLAVPTVFALTQDAEGFIWIGTAGGLVRYDGSEMRRWAADVITRGLSTLSAGPGGEVLVAEVGGVLYRITAEGVEPLSGPDGRPFAETRDASFDSVGRLWVVTATREVYFRDAQKSWHSVDAGVAFPGERVHGIRPTLDDHVFVLTNQGVWQMRVGESPQKLLDVFRPIDAVEHPAGSVFVLAFPVEGEVIELRRDGSRVVRVKLHARPVDLALRGETVWAAYDRYLVALRGEEPPEIIGPEDDLPGGGPLLVDHEGSLWMGGCCGLIQYPEPETIFWNEKDGLPSPHTRMLAETREGVWVSTWGGVGRVAREGNAWRVSKEKGSLLLCVDDKGTLLVNAAGGIMERRGGRFVKHARLPDGFETCAHASDGTLLLATSRGLFRDMAEGKPPEPLNGPPGADGRPASLFRVFEDDELRLWAATSEGSVCHASAPDVLSGRPAAWSCQLIHPVVNIFDIVKLPGGSVWMSTHGAGVWRLSGDRWEPIPASRTLPSQVVFNLTPSPAGGVWVIGHGTTMRVVERPDTAEGWEAVESLSLWEGLRGGGAGDLVEEPDGSLWLATSSGVARVPAEARRAAAPPRVRLVEVVLNGRGANASGEAPQLRDGSQVELHFAALSFRDRQRLRYQYRLRADAPWTDSRESAPVLRFVDLGAGRYRAEVRASLDGVNWSPEPARFAFEVLSPWYERPAALVLFALLAVGAFYAAHRVRVAVLLRLERQRAQIALDLHDEMGSGLGSIGILSGLAAEETLDGVRRRDLARKIAETAGELGHTLTEIVWTLRPGDTTLEALAYHLAERGGRLFPGGETTFETDFPTRWPRGELSLAARRNLLLIASEALHNAARHARARRVRIGFAPAGRGGRWRMWVEDDGPGFGPDPSERAGSGVGLTSMRRRAEEIGAQFSLTKDGGTVVSVVFDPLAESLRLS